MMAMPTLLLISRLDERSCIVVCVGQCLAPSKRTDEWLDGRGQEI